MVVSMRRGKANGSWLVSLCESPRVYTLICKNDADLKRKIKFLQKHVPLYGLKPPPTDFVAEAVKRTFFTHGRDMVDTVCIVTNRGGCEDFIRRWYSLARRVLLVSDLYGELAQELFDQTGATIIKTAHHDTGFCIDLNAGCLYLRHKRLVPAGAGTLDMAALYGVYRDSQKADLFCDRWQFDNKREISLYSLPIK